MTKDMNTLPEHVKSFNNELAEMLTQKPPVSSSKMKDITRCAMKAQKYYKHIVMSVEKLIQKCKPEYKLSGVYVIDGIVRQSRHQNKDRDVYAGRFEVNIHVTAQHLFKCSRTDQVKICRTFKLWELNGVFSYHSMQKCLNNSAPDIRKEGIQLAEKSKMAVKPVTVTSDLAKQQKELEEQRRKIKQQEEELQRKKEALLQNQNLSASSIPPILNSLLHFGASSQSNENAPPPEKDTATKVKSLLDDFDYSDEDEIRQPTGGKKGTPKSKTATSPGSTATPKKVENVSTPSPITTTHDTSIYEPDPVPVPTEKTYDTKDLEKLYTPSPIEKTSKRTKTKSPEKVKEKKSHKRDKSSERSSRRESEKSRDRDRSRSEHDSSRDTSRDHKSRDDSSRRRSSPDRSKKSSKSSNRGKRSRSTSPDHYSRKRDRISKPDCVSVLSTTIWIGNLRKTVTKEDIASLMKKYTNKCTIDMVSARGCSYINLNEREIAETVLKELKDLKLHGAPCKVAWAPGKGCKEHREHWNMDKGITFIPHKTFEKLKITLLEEGGFIAQSTLPQGFKIADVGDAIEVKNSSVSSLLLPLPANLSVFSQQQQTPKSVDNNASDEEMVDAFPPIPLLPVPTPSYPAGMAGLAPLAPPAAANWGSAPPPRPTPPAASPAPGFIQSFSTAYPLPPPHQIPLPNMPPGGGGGANTTPLVPPAAGHLLPGPLPLPNLNQIPLPTSASMHNYDPSRVPFAPTVSQPSGGNQRYSPQNFLHQYKRSPSPPSPRSLERAMATEEDGSPEGSPKTYTPTSKVHAGSLPRFDPNNPPNPRPLFFSQPSRPIRPKPPESKDPQSFPEPEGGIRLPRPSMGEMQQNMPQNAQRPNFQPLDRVIPRFDDNNDGRFNNGARPSGPQRPLAPRLLGPARFGNPGFRPNFGGPQRGGFNNGPPRYGGPPRGQFMGGGPPQPAFRMHGFRPTGGGSTRPAYLNNNDDRH